MQPYYSDASCTIYHADCRDALQQLRADLIVTDAPYFISDAPQTLTTHGNLRVGRRAGHVNAWHAPSEWDKLFDPLYCQRVCDAAPLVAWFGHWRKRADVEHAMAWPIRCELVWAKDTHVGPPCPAAMQDERIWIFARDAVQPQRFETTVWTVPIIPTWAHRHHKNEKPEALMLRLLSWLPLGTVCDPFMGSGTTLVAAKRLNRRAIGIEINESHCETAAQRLSQGTLALFAD
jgi:DNA modification methylase